MPNNFPTFDKFQAEAIFYLVMLSSPFVTEAKNEFRKSTSLSSFKAPQIDLIATEHEVRIGKDLAHLIQKIGQERIRLCLCWV